MADEQNVGDLSAEETAYFESGGETALPQEQAQPPAEGGEEQQPPEPGELDKPRDEKGKFVPHQVFHAEREEHKRTKHEVQELREFRARVEEKLKWTEALLQTQQPPAKEADPDPEPDPNVDIFAHNAWLKRQLEHDRAERAAERQQVTEQQQVQDQEAALWRGWQADTKDFVASTPDGNEAFAFLAETRDKQLAALAVADPRLRTEEGRVAQMNAELAQIIMQARQNGIRPAQAVYEIAKSWGYQGAAAAQQEQQPPALSDRLAGIAKAQEASRSIGQTTGRTADDPMSAEAILNMPEKEFMEWVKLPANAQRFSQLTGG